MSFLFVILVLFVVSAPFAGCLDSWDDFAGIIEKVPRRAKYDFVRERFFLGYQLRHNPDLKCKMPKDYCDTSLKLIILLEKDSSVERHKADFERRTQVCFPNIGCIDPSDPGIRP